MCYFLYHQWFYFLILIPSIGSTFQPKLVLGIFILTWTNDTFAYLIGKRFGKRKLKEKISPKKTIEGFIGGLLAALIGGAIIFNTTLLYSPVILVTFGAISIHFRN